MKPDSLSSLQILHRPGALLLGSCLDATGMLSEHNNLWIIISHIYLARDPIPTPSLRPRHRIRFRTRSHHSPTPILCPLRVRRPARLFHSFNGTCEGVAHPRI